MSELEPTRTYSNPTATDVLRRLLDERGVEWHRGKLAMLDDEYTQWWVSDRMEGFVAYECDYPLNTLIVRGITPAQAIAATLGAGTCREVMINRHWRGCSECGYVWENMYGEGFQKGPNYCPICGRRVEQ